MTAPVQAVAHDRNLPHVERLARAGGFSVLGAGFHAAAGFGLTALITNGFDKATAGTIFAATALFLIVSAITQLGTEVGLVRWLPALIVHGRRDDAIPMLRVALWPVLLVSICVAALGFVFAPEVAHLLAPKADPGELAAQLKILSCFVPVAAVFNVVLAGTRGLGTMAPTVAVDSLGRAAVQLVAVAVVQVLGWGALAVMVAWSTPYALGLVVAVMWLAALLRYRPPGEPGQADGAPTGRVSAGAFWRFTAPRALGTTSQLVLKRADIVLVAALASPAEAALYAAATRFVVVGQLGVQALQQALGPHVSARFADNDLAGARALYRATTAWAMLIAWPIYLLCASLAPQLLRLFGPGYSEVSSVVVLLSLAMLVATSCGAVDTVLLMSGHTWLSLCNNMFALVLNLCLNLVLIPAYGALGAGIAWTISILVRNVLPLVQISAKYRISPIGRHTAAVAALSIVCFGLLPLVPRLLSLSALWTVAGLFVGAGLYVVAVFHWRAELQLSAFRSMLRVRRNRRVGIER